MKRYSGFFNQIVTPFNIEQADRNARKNKTRSKKYILKHDLNKEEENKKIIDCLGNGTYSTSRYIVFKIYEPKEREIYRLPYYPDRIVHHAIMNILEPFWKKQFIRTTYSCIKGRGIHKCLHDIYNTVHRYPKETLYCLKLDIKKFYPSIDHDVLKSIIRKIIKDKKLLRLLDEIIESVEHGVPIGNYLSQFFANLYLTYFDIWCKQELKCKWYFRYADDIVILSSDKEFLHKVLICIKLYLREVLKLEVKTNYRIFPVSQGIDFVGYMIYSNKIRLRKSIKIRLLKLLNRYMRGEVSYNEFHKRFASYKGWLKYTTDKRLIYYINENLKYRE